MTTPRKPLPEINRCYWCGEPVLMTDHAIKINWVYCKKNNCEATGPERKTKRGAINAWNNPRFR